MIVSATTASHCPICGRSKAYHLEDGRMKCALCAHKFTPLPRHSHLSKETIRIIGQRFWEMINTTAVATELNLNIKTVQRYYLRIREGMARSCEEAAQDCFGTDYIPFKQFERDGLQAECGSQAQPICAVVGSADTISLLFCNHEENLAVSPNSIEMIGWLYGRTQESLERHLLDQMHLYLYEGRETELPRQFWQFAKKGLARYQGGFRHNFPLFLREMEFRFKVRQRPDAADLCCQLLIDHTTHQE